MSNDYGVVERPSPAETSKCRHRTRLLVIAIPHPDAAITDLARADAAALPIGTDDDEDLICGACDALLLTDWTVCSTSRKLVVESHMLIRCPDCRAYNVVPTRKPEAPGDQWLRRGVPMPAEKGDEKA